MDQDLELMLRVRRGDAESFELLLRRHRAPLVNYFSRMVRDCALAEDLSQEVFLRVYQARHRYHAEARFTTWPYRIATNLALNAIRDLRGFTRRTESVDQGSDGESYQLVDSQPT